MRKYAISKPLYAILIALILSLSIGYTYAYFSAFKTAGGKASIHNVDITWINALDYNPLGTNTINVTGNLKRGRATEISVNGTAINLGILNDSSVDVYCRVKLVATYTSSAVTNKDCSQWIKLARGNNTLLEDVSDWVYIDGYYYYGTEDTSTGDNDSGGIGVIPTPITVENNTQSVANMLYLVEDTSADIYGATVNITLTLEAVQASNDAYKSEWK